MKLLINKDDVQDLSFEEVMKRYEGQVKNIIKIYLKYFEYEELMQIGYMGLWKAYRNYDFDRGVGFGHVASFYIQNEIRNHIRQINRHNVPWESYNATVRYENEELELINILEDTENHFEEIECSLFIESILNLLTEQQREVLSLRLKDYSQVQIAEKLGLDQGRVSRSLKASKKKILAIA